MTLNVFNLIILDIPFTCVFDNHSNNITLKVEKLPPGKLSSPEKELRCKRKKASWEYDCVSSNFIQKVVRLVLLDKTEEFDPEDETHPHVFSLSDEVDCAIGTQVTSTFALRSLFGNKAFVYATEEEDTKDNNSISKVNNSISKGNNSTSRLVVRIQDTSDLLKRIKQKKKKDTYHKYIGLINIG
eukprot:GHVR01042099.1.p1 GENE.GHVR01042099.1~~GHVR01042099.1.p1  ORF type:complete len:185 (+),score=27.28 GHVR01042099.1:208-762(+)